MELIFFLILYLTICDAMHKEKLFAVKEEPASAPIPDGRIVGGVKTRIEAFPYQVSLSNSGSHICGGSIINSHVILTAAHCVSGRRAKMLSIRAGASQHNQGGVVISVQEIIVHPNFNSNSLDRDIALLVLSSALSFSATVQSIEIATSSDLLNENTALIVSGWGATKEGSTASTTLRYTQVQLVNQKACARSYGGSGVVTSNMFCAGVIGGGRDSCQGDSGGPLITYSGDNPKLHGIVSWGYGCARPRYPGVYTKVANMYEWVESNLKVLKY